MISKYSINSKISKFFVLLIKQRSSKILKWNFWITSSVVCFCWFYLLGLVSFATTRTVVHQVPPSMGFPMQTYWHGLPFPSPGELPNLGIEPTSPALTTMEALSVNFINKKYTLCFWPEQILPYYSSWDIISIFPTSFL